MNNSNLIRRGKPTLSHRLSRPWLILDWIYSLTSTASAENAHTQSMKTFAMQTIDAHQYLRQISRTTPNRFCLLNFLIDLADTHSEFTYADVVEETITFMLAGQDAVGAALASSIFLLAQNVECQTIARQEIELIDANRAKQNHPEHVGASARTTLSQTVHQRSAASVSERSVDRSPAERTDCRWRPHDTQIRKRSHISVRHPSHAGTLSGSGTLRSAPFRCRPIGRTSSVRVHTVQCGSAQMHRRSVRHARAAIVCGRNPATL